MRYTNAELLEHLASSYVLGTLRGRARRRFERVQADRADVRTRVVQWEMRLGQLAASVPAQKPSAKVWTAIAARTQPAPPHAAPGVGWSWPLRLLPTSWALGGLAAGVLGASALFLLAPTLFVSSEGIAMRSGERLPPSYVGLLTDPQGSGKVLVSSLRHGKTMTIKIIGAISPAKVGRYVLWAIPTDGPPFAVGSVPASGTAVSTLPDTSEKLFSKVGKLAITEETEATPTSPHGVVLFSGNCAKLW